MFGAPAGADTPFEAKGATAPAANLTDAPAQGVNQSGTAALGDGKVGSWGGGRLVVLSGPSGVGKGTVVEAARRAQPGLWLSVSVTTRPRRAGEIDGDHYHFISASQFDHLVACDGLLEWATFAGNRYGTPSEPVRAQVAAGNAVLLEIELEGARQVRSRVPDALMVFLAPPSFAALEERLRGRGTEDEAAIGQRLARARTEMAAASEFDEVIVNDDVGRAAHALLSLLAPPAQ